jgi:hypothetical protein
VEPDIAPFDETNAAEPGVRCRSESQTIGMVVGVEGEARGAAELIDAVKKLTLPHTVHPSDNECEAPALESEIADAQNALDAVAAAEGAGPVTTLFSQLCGLRDIVCSVCSVPAFRECKRFPTNC